MAIAVNIHPDKYDVALFPARTDDEGAFAVVKAFEDKGSVSLFLPSVDAADELIKAAVEAKDKLLGVPLPHEPIAPRCESTNIGLTIPGEQVSQCSLEQGHQGLHAACTPTGVAIAEWDDEPEAPDPDACKCGHAGYQHVYTGHEPCTQCECKAFGVPSGGVMFGPFSDTAASLA